MKPMWQKEFHSSGPLGEVMKCFFGYRWVLSFHGGESVLLTGRSRTLLGAINACENYNALDIDVREWKRVDKEMGAANG